jgi:hypothetical protein
MTRFRVHSYGIALLTLGVLAPLPGAGSLPDEAGGLHSVQDRLDRMPTDSLPLPLHRVAGLIRAALESPDDEAAWSRLAAALPEVGGKGDTEAGFGRDAAWVADSLASAVAGFSSRGSLSGDASVGSPGGGMPLGERPSQLLRQGAEKLNGVFLYGAHRIGQEGWRALALALLPLLGLVLLKSLRRGRGEPGMGREGAASVGRRGKDARTNLATAQAMWDSGLPPNEIARRTGLSQDALFVMANLQRGHGQ